MTDAPGAPPGPRGRGWRIGVTIGLHSEAETLWNSGIKQNALFLCDALRHCPAVDALVLVNTTAVAITEALPWDLDRWPTRSFEEAKDAVDLLIELGGQVNEAQTRYLKGRGVRLVSYCCGFEYVHAMEAILFERPLWGAGLYVNRGYDAIWMIPQVADISGSYFSALRRAPAQCVPLVWDPVLLTRRSALLPGGGVCRPRPGACRVTVFEANLDVVKFCLYPALIADLAHRRRPELIGLLQVMNAERMATQSQEFIALMNYLDLVRDHKAVFLGTHETPEFLASHTDVVVAHQWDNPLNYLYLEVCWQGYPLVHNAALCAELGHYYAGHDLAQGSERLIEAMDRDPAELEAYRATQRARIARFRPGDPVLTGAYARLLEAVMG